jgi:hypothetical protein
VIEKHKLESVIETKQPQGKYLPDNHYELPKEAFQNLGHGTRKYWKALAHDKFELRESRYDG